MEIGMPKWKKEVLFYNSYIFLFQREEKKGFDRG